MKTERKTLKRKDVKPYLRLFVEYLKWNRKIGRTERISKTRGISILNVGKNRTDDIINACERAITKLK